MATRFVDTALIFLLLNSTEGEVRRVVLQESDEGIKSAKDILDDLIQTYNVTTIHDELELWAHAATMTRKSAEERRLYASEIADTVFQNSDEFKAAMNTLPPNHVKLIEAERERMKKIFETLYLLSLCPE